MRGRWRHTARTPPFAARSGGCSNTSASLRACACAPSRPNTPPTPAPLWAAGHHLSLSDGAPQGGGRGRWLWCGACGYNADRDYAASLNIARLGVTYLEQMQATSTAKRSVVRDRVVKPVSYTGAGAGLLLPPPGSHARPQRCGEDLLLSWLAQDRLPAIVSAAAHLSAPVRLRM